MSRTGATCPLLCAAIMTMKDIRIWRDKARPFERG